MTTSTAFKVIPGPGCCAECGRQVGMLPSGRALPYTTDAKGRRHCAHRPACKLAAMAPAAATIDHPKGHR